MSIFTKRTFFAAATSALFALVLFPQSASALTIGPPTQDLSLDPGNTGFGVIRIFNEEEREITVYPIVMNFEPDDREGGSPALYSADEDRLGRGLASWVDIDDSAITLGPKERVELPYAVNVPDNAQPGGHYGAIVVSTQPPDAQGGTIAIGQRLAALLLLTVSGEVDERGGIAEFGFTEPQVWYNHLPVDFFLRFENSGNTHLRPVGNLFVEDVFGRQVASVQVNEKLGSILPLSIRRFEFGWARTREDMSGMSGLERELRNFAIGKHTATLVLTYGQGGQLVTEQRVFYVWPWRLMSIGGVASLVLITVLIILKRRYDKGVIKKFEKMQTKE